jgi:hypothetical protein
MADSHNAPAEAAQKILLLPADAFFVRLIPLAVSYTHLTLPTID